MTTFNGRISTEYLKHPRVNPDFIFLDGPDQFKVKKNINGISTRHKDMMPMVCDILIAIIISIMRAQCPDPGAPVPLKTCLYLQSFWF